MSFKIKILGALATLPPIQDVAKLLYFLTGASTERQAVLAYNHFIASSDDINNQYTIFADEISGILHRESHA